MARNDGLRDYQQEMKLRLFEEWELHRSVMVQMPVRSNRFSAERKSWWRV